MEAGQTKFTIDFIQDAAADDSEATDDTMDSRMGAGLAGLGFLNFQEIPELTNLQAIVPENSNSEYYKRARLSSIQSQDESIEN